MSNCDISKTAEISQERLTLLGEITLYRLLSSCGGCVDGCLQNVLQTLKTWTHIAWLEKFGTQVCLCVYVKVT